MDIIKKETFTIIKLENGLLLDSQLVKGQKFNIEVDFKEFGGVKKFKNVGLSFYYDEMAYIKEMNGKTTSITIGQIKHIELIKLTAY